MAKRTNIKTIRLVALILMLFPLLALIGVILYLVDTAQGKVTKVELIFLILTIPFGFCLLYTSDAADD